MFTKPITFQDELACLSPEQIDELRNSFNYIKALSELDPHHFLSKIPKDVCGREKNPGKYQIPKRGNKCEDMILKELTTNDSRTHLLFPMKKGSDYLIDILDTKLPEYKLNEDKLKKKNRDERFIKPDYNINDIYSICGLENKTNQNLKKIIFNPRFRRIREEISGLRTAIDDLTVRLTTGYEFVPMENVPAVQALTHKAISYELALSDYLKRS